MSVIIGIAIALGICFVLVAMLVVKGFRRKISTGTQGMIGLEVEAISDLNNSEIGQVLCHGEIWRAKSERGTITKGTLGIVRAIDGMTLTIRAKD